VYGLLDKLVLEFIIYFSILSKWLVQDDLENSPWQQGSTFVLQTTHCSWPWTNTVWDDWPQ